MATHILGGPVRPAKPKKELRPDARVQRPDFRIMDIITGLAGSYNNTSCYPTQKKLLELLARFAKWRPSLRTLNRHLGTLEDMGWLRRIQRTRYDKQRGHLFRSTRYVPGWQYCRRMASHAVATFKIVNAHRAAHSSSRVTKLAQYINSFFKEFINEPVDKSSQAQSP